MARPTLGTFLRRLRQAMTAEAMASCSDVDLIEQFRSKRDEFVFQAIVDRHGPMVFQVCCRVLSSQADIEDAFQATFLILIRRGHTIRRHASLGSWLHGVARRTALKLRTQIDRRRHREVRSSRPELAEGVDEISWRELRGILDEELQRLPESCRAPLVLCYLEGRTQDEAAAQLNMSRSSLRLRLDRGRDLLGRRLTRRGVALTAVLSARLLSESTHVAGMPRVLLTRTIESINHTATNHAAAASVLPPRVAALSDGVIKTMHVAQYKSIVAMLACSLALAIGVYQINPRLASAQDGKSNTKVVGPAVTPDIEPIDPNLVFDPDVQKQLRLSPNQVRQLGEAREKGTSTVAEQSQRIGEIDQRIKKLQEEIDKLQQERNATANVIHKAQSDQVKNAIPKVLSRDAVQQLRQITLQRMRLSDILLDAKMRTRLDLNDEQVKKIQEITDKGGPQRNYTTTTKYLSKLYQRAEFVDLDQSYSLMSVRDFGDASGAELLKVLTPPQRQVLERLSGMTFEKTK
jgi:RNA polymerase sigma factor (sigma-70 family)